MSDSGFAPNPFNGFMSLATCKPRLRKVANAGDWVAGFSGKTLKVYENRESKTLGFGKLIFTMKVTEKVTFEQYSFDSKSKVKILKYIKHSRFFS